jgi:hypothetical protein
MANKQPSVSAAQNKGSGQSGSKPAAGQSQLADELKAMEWEPLLPVEKKLIGWSITLGVVLLGILVWVSYTFFPSGH